jgi:hypothetical protein
MYYIINMDHIFSSFFYLLKSPSGLFSSKINLRVWILQTVSRTSWTAAEPCPMPLSIEENTNTEPRVEVELTVLVFERVKAVYSSDHKTICQVIDYR